MKKLLACLLALMLPLCAMAETASVTWTTEVSPEGLTRLIDLMQTAAPDAALSLTDKQTAALAEFMSGFSASVGVHESGELMRFVIAYGNETLMDLDCMIQKDEYLYTSSLLPGILLTTPLDVSDKLLEEIIAAWENQPWLALWSRYLRFAERWDGSLDQSVEYGSFAGDTYSGGKRRVTYRFDERDVALLLESIITADEVDDVATLLHGYGLQYFDDADGLTNALCQRIRDAAMENRYSYVLRIVDDGTEGPQIIGLSLLVYEQDQLVSTLSASENTVVLGYGLRGENCYLSLETSDAANAPMMLAKLWHDPTRAGYHAASGNEANLLFSAALYQDETDAPLSMRAEIDGPALNNIPVTLALTLTDSDTAAELALSVTVDGLPLSTSRMTISVVDDLPAMETEGLRRIDLNDPSDEDADVLDDAIDDAANELAVKLFKLMPPELLTIFMNGI